MASGIEQTSWMGTVNASVAEGQSTKHPLLCALIGRLNQHENQFYWLLS